MQQPAVGRTQQGRLINESQELLAFGDVELHGSDITMRVSEEHVSAPHKADGDLTLVLDDGRSLTISNRFIRLQLRGGESEASTTIYRMHTMRV